MPKFFFRLTDHFFTNSDIQFLKTSCCWWWDGSGEEDDDNRSNVLELVKRGPNHPMCWLLHFKFYGHGGQCHSNISISIWPESDQCLALSVTKSHFCDWYWYWWCLMAAYWKRQLVEKDILTATSGHFDNILIAPQSQLDDSLFTSRSELKFANRVSWRQIDKGIVRVWQQLFDSC